MSKSDLNEKKKIFSLNYFSTLSRTYFIMCYFNQVKTFKCSVLIADLKLLKKKNM